MRKQDARGIIIFATTRIGDVVAMITTLEDNNLATVVVVMRITVVVVVAAVIHEIHNVMANVDTNGFVK